MENTLHSAIYIPQPMTFADNCTTTYSIVLIGSPHYENNVERSGCVVKKFRHNRFHSLKQPHTRVHSRLFRREISVTKDDSLV